MAKIFQIFNTYVAPGVDNTSDLGSTTFTWKDLYAQRILATTTTGLSIATTTNQKVGFFGTTPVVQQANTTDLRSLLINFGFLATGGANPLDLNGGLFTANAATITTIVTVGTVSASGNVISGTLVSGASGSFSTVVVVADSAYSSDWNGSVAVPTRNAVYDKIEALSSTSGTYTPTLTNIVNLTGSTAFECQYMRVGGTVTVSGKVNIAPTLTATLTSLGISLPVASDFGATEDCAGTAASPSIAAQIMGILGDATNNRATLAWRSADITSQDTYFIFTYQVI